MALVPSCLKEYLKLFVNGKSRAAELRLTVTWGPLTAHSRLQTPVGFVLILCETRGNRGP